MTKNTYIDLFAGCGGLSLGLHNSGWSGLFAIEKNPLAYSTLRYNLIEKIQHFNWPSWLPESHHDINEVISNYSDELVGLKGQIDLIVGGPPCQGFSMAGRRNENDERNDLINSYVKFISLVKPKLIFFENVKGFTLEFKNNKQKGRKYSAIVSEKLEREGYYICGKLVNFGEYGIPQKRTRFILVGVRKDIENSSQERANSFFEILETNKYNFLINKDLPLFPTIRDAISDLCKNEIVNCPDRKGFKSSKYGRKSSKYQKYLKQSYISCLPDSHSFAKHSERIINRLKYIIAHTKLSVNLSDKMKLELGISKQIIVPLKANEQSPTLTSNPDDLIHYCEPRTLTVREYARIQSFPDDFAFKGKYTTGGKLRKFDVPRYTQIGNAIPPLFGEQSGIILKTFI